MNVGPRNGGNELPEFIGYIMNDNLVQATLRIYARKYFYPITNEAACYIKQYGDASVPISRRIADKVLTLPLYADLIEEDVDKICDVILR